MPYSVGLNFRSGLFISGRLRSIRFCVDLLCSVHFKYEFLLSLFQFNSGHISSIQLSPGHFGPKDRSHTVIEINLEGGVL